MKKIFLLTCVAMLFFSCKTHSKFTTSASATQQEALSIGNTWVLKSIKAKKINSSDDNRVVYIQFNTEAKSINGYAGCNRFFGTYEEPQPGKLNFSAMGATKMACPEHEMEIEDLFLASLNRVNGYKIEGNTLELLQNETVLMTFEQTKLNKEE